MRVRVEYEGTTHADRRFNAQRGICVIILWFESSNTVRSRKLPSETPQSHEI